MSGMTSGPKIVLIGGPVTADDGTVLDSRQQIEGDDTSDVMRKALAGSWLWWSTVSSLVMPILEAAGPRAFALVIGERSVLDLRADGSMKRTSLRGLLPGGTGSVEVVRTGMRDDALPDRFEEVTTLHAWNGQSMGKIGVQRIGSPDARWRFLGGNPFYLQEALQRINPTVIIDTTDQLTSRMAFDENLLESVLQRMRAEAPGNRFRSFEQQRLLDDTVLVRPHTYRLEAILREYTDWVQSGRTESSGSAFVCQSSSWDPAAPVDPIRYTRVIPISADFQATGVIQNGRWEPPEALEAARSLLAARFDLKIGIWDLVANQILRRTLLKESPVSRAPVHVTRVPRAAAGRAESTVASKQAQRLEEKTALELIRSRASALSQQGWEPSRDPNFMWLPLTKPVQRWSEEVPFPLVWLSLSIVKRQCSIIARTTMYNQVSVPHYVSDRRSIFQSLAGMHLPALDANWPVIWSAKGGWGDSVDWDTRFHDLAALTPGWVGAFRDLVDHCGRLHEGRPGSVMAQQDTVGEFRVS